MDTADANSTFAADALSCDVGSFFDNMWKPDNLIPYPQAPTTALVLGEAITRHPCLRRRGLHKVAPAAQRTGTVPWVSAALSPPTRFMGLRTHQRVGCCGQAARNVRLTTITTTARCLPCYHVNPAILRLQLTSCHWSTHAGPGQARMPARSHAVST